MEGSEREKSQILSLEESESPFLASKSTESNTKNHIRDPSLLRSPVELQRTGRRKVTLKE